MLHRSQLVLINQISINAGVRMNFASRRFIEAGVSHLVIVLSLCFFSVAQAGTIVRISTTVGDYSIELLDDVAPVTVRNFLNYVTRGDYNRTYLHRVEDGFVVQGGAYRFQPFVGPIDIRQDAPIVNEFNVSNTRGTVAMAKFEGSPNSATNQWFVNLTNNSSLDGTNGGFTVFGVVLGEGMLILDAIDALPFVSLGVKASSAPYITAAYESPTAFVYQNAVVTSRFSSAPHVFESVTGKMITSVNVNSGAELISLHLNAVPHASQLILQADVQSVISRRATFDGIATYSTTDNRLRIPALEVNLNGVVSVLKNVVFVLSNRELLQFTMESFSQ